MNGTLTSFLAVVGALGGLASIKMIVDYFTPCKIVGKMISRYYNVNTKDKTQTFFLFKLSVLAKNKPFNLRQIKCEIEDSNGKTFLASALNMRYVIFTNPGDKDDKYIVQKLLVSGDEYLNNSSFLPVNKNVDGYLIFTFEGNLDCEIWSTTFIFESFVKRIEKLEFKESDIHGKHLFWDDNIWQTLDKEEIEK
ncbi:MAG: hypothetical protein GY774_17100 [Planctomycetes bacterium]|nr:hypothetical protein [Planctomycetota bacterium]